MSKIRINELARELEVKPSRILEVLPEIGVEEKKTHSSSLDDELADLVRGFFGRPPLHHKPIQEEKAAPAETMPVETAATLVEPESAPSPPAVPSPSPRVGEETKEEKKEEKKEEHGPTPPHFGGGEFLPQRPVPRPLRPPLAGMKPATVPPPPPVTAPPPAPPPVTAPPPAPPTVSDTVAAPPPATTTVAAPPAPPAAAPPPAAAGPRAPLQPPPVSPRPPIRPAVKPGQIISGPRQPLPPLPREAPKPPAASGLAPGTPIHPKAPSPARVVATRPGQPVAPPPPPPPPPRQEAPAAASGRPTLAGQPAPRPVVPPRPDMVARLTQAQPRAAVPGMPQPRPGIPSRTGGPVPGQPIYRGPIRPGQPLVRSGAPSGPGVLAPRGRQRGLHPTTPVPPEPSVAPTEVRRHQGKPSGRAKVVDREVEKEGKLHHLPSRRHEQEVVAVNKEITISEGITVKELAEKLGLKVNILIKKLLEKKIFATINQTLDVKLAEEVAASFGATSSQMSFEQETTQEIELAEDEKDIVRRAPVVTVMGHVDHGKTSLLDAIRLSNVAEHEAGGITQHIGAYTVEKDGRLVVFIDTPGHEAFTRMRARGAKVTDIVILVVAADDGVMPQTLEAIDHARAAGVPIIVAINKIDKPDAQPERVKQQLADRGLLAEDWGGDVVMVPVSAKTKQNLELLLEMILLVADMQDLKANPSRPGVCTILEAQLDRGRGPVATVLVRNGVLRVGDYFICGTVFGKVRALINDRGDSVKEAGPSMPVEVLGLESLPEVGDTLQVVTDIAKAKQIVDYREAKAREQSLARTNRVSLEKLHEQLREGEVKELNLILKADVGGSAEVLTETLQKLSNDKVRIRVIHSGVGAITETDVLLASASNAIVIGFNVRPDRNALAVAEQEKVDIRLHTIIYDLTQEIKQAMAGLLEPVVKELYKGRALVREIFRISKVGTVAGCVVIDGVIQRGCEVRLLRDNVVVHTGKLEGLRRFKDDVNEVKNGLECGIALANYSDIKPNDVIEAFVTERVAAEVVA